MTVVRQPAIIFDFGNVLLDWNPRYLYRKLLPNEQAVEDFLQAVRFFEWNQAHDAGKDFEESIAQLCAQHPQYCGLIRAYNERYEESISGAILPVVAILSELKRLAYPLYGLTNWPAGKFAQVRPQYPFFDWFDEIVVSGEVGVIKPDPRIFHLLLERIQRPAQACLFIDDAHHNVEAARRIGLNTIHYLTPDQLQADLEAFLGCRLQPAAAAIIDRNE